MPIAEGRKILRAKGERVFQQEAKEEQRFGLPMFERFTSRKPRMSFKVGLADICRGGGFHNHTSQDVSPPGHVQEFCCCKFA